MEYDKQDLSVKECIELLLKEGCSIDFIIGGEECGTINPKSPYKVVDLWRDIYKTIHRYNVIKVAKISYIIF